jgi:hypothetical protein
MGADIGELHEPDTRHETVAKGAVTAQMVIGAGSCSSTVSFAATATPDENARCAFGTDETTVYFPAASSEPGLDR